MGRILSIVFAVVILVVGGLVIAPSFIDWSAYRTQIQEQVQAASGYEVDFGSNLQLSLLPRPAIYADEITLSNPAHQRALMSLERLDVNIDPLPLLSGKVVISAVQLVKPDLYILQTKDSSFNWITPKLKAMMESDGAQTSEVSSQDLTQNITLERLEIKDGRVIFVSAQGAETKLESINLTLRAQTLRGPFAYDGEAVFNAQPIALAGTVGEMIKDQSSIPLTAQGRYMGFDFKYAGIVETGTAFALQGETALSAASLSKALKTELPLKSDSFSVSGLLNANQNQARLQNAKLNLAGVVFAPAVQLDVKTMALSVEVKAKDALNLDDVLIKGAAQSKTSGVDALSQIVPANMTLPAGMTLNAKLSAPSVVYSGVTYQNPAVDLALKDQTLTLGANIQNMPGQGRAKIDAELSAKTHEIPSLDVEGDIAVADLPAAISAFTGQKFEGTLDKSKGAKTVFVAQLTPGEIRLRKADITFNGTPYGASGSLKGHDVSATINALGGEAMISGRIADDFLWPEASFHVKHANLAKALQEMSGAASYPPMLRQPLNLSGQMVQAGQKYELKNLKGDLGKMTIVGSVGYDANRAPVLVSGNVRLGDVVLDLGAAPAKSSKGRWSGDAIDMSWLTGANVDLQLEAHRLQYASWDLKTPKLDVQIKDGALTLKQLSAGLYDGRASVSGVMQVTDKGLVVEGQPELSAINLEPLVKSLAGNAIIKGKGSIDLKANLKTIGVSQQDLIKNLSGQGSVTGQDLVLEGLDLTRFAKAMSSETKPGDTLMGVWKGATKGGSTAFETLDGAFSVEKGIIDLSKLDLDGQKAAIATTGVINAPKSTLKTAHTITLKDEPNVPPFTINIEGPLDNPAQTFAQGALTDYFARKLNRKLEKILSDKLGDKLGGQLGGALGGALLGIPPSQQPQQQPQQAPVQQQQVPANDNEPQPQSPEEAFQGLLKGLIR